MNENLVITTMVDSDFFTPDGTLKKAGLEEIRVYFYIEGNEYAAEYGIHAAVERRRYDKDHVTSEAFKAAKRSLKADHPIARVVRDGMGHYSWTGGDEALTLAEQIRFHGTAEARIEGARVFDERIVIGIQGMDREVIDDYVKYVIDRGRVPSMPDED